MKMSDHSILLLMVAGEQFTPTQELVVIFVCTYSNVHLLTAQP